MPPKVGERRAAAKARVAAKGRAKALARLLVAKQEGGEDSPVVRRPAGKTYWEAPVTLCGIVDRMEEDGAGIISEVRLTGTENEDLLRWSTENPGCRCKLHHCREGCVAGVCEDGLVHVKKLKLRLPGAGETWLDNLVGHVPVQMDEMAALRDRANELDKEDARERGKDKKVKEKSKEGREKKRSRGVSSSSTSSSSRRRKKKKKKARKGVKVEAVKELSAVFGRTGMDPDVKVRRQVVRKVKKGEGIVSIEGRRVTPIEEDEEQFHGKSKGREMCREGCLKTEEETLDEDIPRKMTDRNAGEKKHDEKIGGEKGVPDSVGEMLGGHTFGEGAVLLGASLYQHLVASYMTKCIGNSFPLPSAFGSLEGLFPSARDEELRILQNIIWSLNHLNGSPVSMGGFGTPCQQRLLGGLMEQARSAGEWTEKAEVLDWEELFRVKGVDYQGEEVKGDVSPCVAFRSWDGRPFRRVRCRVQTLC